MTDDQDIPDDTTLAAEYVLRLLDVAAAQAFDPAWHATLTSDDGAVHIEAGYAPKGRPVQGHPQPGRSSTRPGF